MSDYNSINGLLLTKLPRNFSYQPINQLTNHQHPHLHYIFWRFHNSPNINTQPNRIHSLSEITELAMDEKSRDIARRKRMIYRSKQRGWLEVDLLMGSWAVENVPKLNEQELDEYEVLLNEETIDIYNYISGKDELPHHLKDLKVMKMMQDYSLVKNMASPEGYASVKKDANLT